MASFTRSVLPHVFGYLRVAAVAVIAGVWRKRGMKATHDRVAALPARDQAVIVGGVLAVLAGLCLLAAQFGVIGLLALALVVVLIVN